MGTAPRYDAWDDAVYNAQQAGTLVVSSAGNEGQVQPVGTCGLSGLGEVPSILTVGALINPGVSYSYSSTPPAASSSEGGVNITTNSQTYYRALSGVDLMVPGYWEFPVNNGGTFGPATGGTSLAAPQVAAAAVNFKHWAISKGWASLCAQLNAYNIPAGTTRQVMVVVYYSADTVMR
ncbi:MAG: S8 family serine peptidase [Archangium sp.]|nr:S8 family serine peptidase [Archangium sp.]